MILASRVAGPDRLELVVRIETNATMLAAKQQAATLARTVASQYGTPSCADVTDAATGLPLCSFSAGVSHTAGFGGSL